MWNEILCILNKSTISFPVYKTTLPNVTSHTIFQNIHKLTIIHGYLFLSPTGEETGIHFTLLPDKSIKLQSLTSMLNYIIILF